MGISKVKNLFGAAKRGYGMLGKGKTVVKNTNPPMIKIKPKPKGSTPKNLNDQKKVYVSDKPAILGKETYNYEGLKNVKKIEGMKEKSQPIKLPPRIGSPKKDYATLSDVKKGNPALYKKYMENLGKKTSKPSSFSERRMTLGGRFPNKKVIGGALVLGVGADLATGGKKTKEKKFFKALDQKLSKAIKEKKK